MATQSIGVPIFGSDSKIDPAGKCSFAIESNGKGSAITGHLVTIEITPQKGKITNSISGISFASRIAVVKVAGETMSIAKLRPIDIPDSATLEIIETNHLDNRTINLPAAMKVQLLKYIRLGGPPKVSFDCNCFAHFLNGYKYQFGWINKRQWDIDFVTHERQLQEGDTVMIGKDSDSITHLAIYLGNELYLSKFGASGPLMVTNLNAMTSSFSGKLIFRIVPLPQFELGIKK